MTWEEKKRCSTCGKDQVFTRQDTRSLRFVVFGGASTWLLCPLAMVLSFTGGYFVESPKALRGILTYFVPLGVFSGFLFVIRQLENRRNPYRCSVCQARACDTKTWINIVGVALVGLAVGITLLAIALWILAR